MSSTTTRPTWPAAVAASADESRGEMPGDGLLGHHRFRTTHAVDIDAPTSAVWPWLVQMGQGRGGFYSYDWLENLVGCRIHSLAEIDPSLQDLAVGDVVRLVPDGTGPPLRYVVAVVEAPLVLVLGPEGSRETAFGAHLPYSVWTFRLSGRGAGGSRLVVRFQHDFAPSFWSWAAYRVALPRIHAVMERRMLLGIRDRAEAAS